VTGNGTETFSANWNLIKNINIELLKTTYLLLSKFFHPTPVCIYVHPCTCYMPRPSISPWFHHESNIWCRFQWPSHLRRESEADRLLGLWVRILPAARVFVWSVVCVVRYMSLRRADPSSRGVIPTVMCLCVWSRNLKNETALVRVGLFCQTKKEIIFVEEYESWSPSWRSFL
jgi:hypothetical protein